MGGKKILMRRCQASWLSEPYAKPSHTHPPSPYPAAAQPQLAKEPSLPLSAGQPHHPSLTSSTASGAS